MQPILLLFVSCIGPPRHLHIAHILSCIMRPLFETTTAIVLGIVSGAATEFAVSKVEQRFEPNGSDLVANVESLAAHGISLTNDGKKHFDEELHQPD